MTDQLTDRERAELPGWALDRINRQREAIEQLRAGLREAERQRDEARAMERSATKFAYHYEAQRDEARALIRRVIELGGADAVTLAMLEAMTASKEATQ